MQIMNTKLFNCFIISISFYQNPTQIQIILTVCAARGERFLTDPMWWKCETRRSAHGCFWICCLLCTCCQAEEERDGMEKVKLDNRRILFNLLPAHVAQHFLMSNPRNMVSLANRQADRQKDKQVDKKAEHCKWRTSEDISYAIILISLCFPLGLVLPVLRTSRCPVCIHSQLQRFLHRAGW